MKIKILFGNPFLPFIKNRENYTYNIFLVFASILQIRNRLIVQNLVNLLFSSTIPNWLPNISFPKKTLKQEILEILNIFMFIFDMFHAFTETQISNNIERTENTRAFFLYRLSSFRTFSFSPLDWFI